MSSPHLSRIAVSNAIRPLFLSGGLIAFAFGFIGLFVPGWPTTVFWIIALYCFKRSSPRFEAYLLNHPLLGSTLRDWDENKWITKRVKAIASACVIGFSGLSLFFISKPSVRWIVVGLAVVGVAYILTRRTKPEHPVPIAQ